MQQPTLSDVEAALQRGQRDVALSLIDVVLTNSPSADGWALAAQIVDAPDDKIKLLDKALELDPNHAGARAQYAALGRTPSQKPVMTLPALDIKDDDLVADTDKVRREGNATVHTEGVYEMLWDCKFCGTKKLLGKTHKFCPVCGAQQDPEWRYYPSDDEKVAVKDHKFVGADKICPNCSSLNTADAEFCTRCGAPQSAAAQVKAQAARTAEAVKSRGAAAGISTGALGFTTEDLDARQMGEKYTHLRPQEKSTSRPKWQIFAVVAVVIGVIAFALFAIFAKREETGYVNAFNWERNISIDRLSAVPGSSECPAPIGAYNVRQNYEQVGSRQVPDGQSCSSRQVDQGDGTFRQEQVCTTKYRSEPVMGYMCYYTVNLWGHSRSVKASGDKNDTPTWPTTNISGCVTLGCEREGGRDETYNLVIVGPESKTYTCAVPFDVWQATTLETAFKFNVRIVGGGIDCSSLERIN